MAKRWTREHDARMKRILETMRTEARPFADDSDEAKAARRALPFDAWCGTYLPHYFSAASAPAHLTADELVEERGMPVYMCWSRGFGKSTRYSLAKPLHWILHRERHFIIFGGRSEDVAADKMEFVKLELKENPRIRQDYGDDLAPRSGEDEASGWVANGVRCWARGVPQQSPRGQRHRQHRPDAFLGDDMDDNAVSRNPQRVDALMDWVDMALMPALEGAGSGATCAILGTMYGRGCMMSRAAIKTKEKDPAGRPLCRQVVFAAVDENGRTNWPERWPQAALDRAHAVMGTRAFRREMRCIEDDESAAFRAEWIRTFDAATFPRDRARVVAYCDPSARAQDVHDFKVWVVLARLDGDERVHCLHAWVRRASPVEMLDEGLRIWETWRPGRVACEDNGFQALLWPLLRSREREANAKGSIPLSGVTNTTNKADRILANAPLFERGLAVFDLAEGDQKLLVDQFLDFGKTGVHDDGPDAWDGACRLLPPPGPAVAGYRGQARDDLGALFGLSREDDPRSRRRGTGRRYAEAV